MKIRKVLAGIILALMTVSGAGAPVYALESGAYVVSNTTYYVNPDTGSTDDGGDTSIGEGMCRNAVYAESLYELKEDKHYLTIRLKLISFINNIQFKVQKVKGDSSSYQEMAYTVVGENSEENTKDFLIELPATDVLINPSFFVVPMDRDVTFFLELDMDTAKKDDGSFAAYNDGAPDPVASEKEKNSDKAADNTGGDTQGAGSKGTEPKLAEPKLTEPKGADAKETDTKETDTKGAEPPEEDAKPEKSQAIKEEPVPKEALSTDVTVDVPENAIPENVPDSSAGETLGIVEFPAEGEAEEGTGEKNKEEKDGTAGGRSAFAGGVMGVLCLAVGGYFWYVKKRKP